MKKESNELYRYHRHSIIFLVPFGVCLHGSWTLTGLIAGYWALAFCWKLQTLSDPYYQSTCLCVTLCVCATLVQNILKTERFRDSLPIGKCLRHVDWWRHRWRHVTMASARDGPIFKVVVFGNWDPDQLSPWTL